MPKLTIIDASHWLHKAYHAFPPLARADGAPTGALCGVLQTLLWQVRRGTLGDASYAVAVFEGEGQTFRRRLDASYKAQRTRRDDLYAQLPAVKDAFAAFGVRCVSVPTCEADDVIAAYATAAVADALVVTILTNDKDLTQLVSGQVILMESMGGKRGEVTDAEVVWERWGVHPHQMADMLALMGDNADNIAGVPGIGEKTAARLIDQFGSLDGLFERLGEVTPDLVRQRLMVHHQGAREAYRLIKLPSPDAPPVLTPAWDELAYDAALLDTDAVLRLCDTWEIVKFKGEFQKEMGLPVTVNLEDLAAD